MAGPGEQTSAGYGFFDAAVARAEIAEARAAKLEALLREGAEMIEGYIFAPTSAEHWAARVREIVPSAKEAEEAKGGQ